MNQPDLIIAAGQGDEAAWEKLIRQHQEAVFRFAYLLLSDADEAEDVAQETFIRAFHALDQFDTRRPLRPWLLRICVNLAHNHRRAAGRYLAALRRLFQAGINPLVAEMPDETTAQWEARLLRQAVLRLSQLDQEIIYLRYFLELSVSETAEVLDIASGTVKSRLARSLKRLRKVVKQEFPALAEDRG